MSRLRNVLDRLCGKTLNTEIPCTRHVFSKETVAIMNKAWKATGKNSDNFPSGFHIELPHQVDGILESGDREAALQHAVNTIEREAVAV